MVLTKPLPIWLALIVIVASSSAALGIAWIILGNNDEKSAPAESQGDWRDVEYEKLDQLRGGLSLAYFQDVLGTPLFVTPSRDGQFTQYLFRGRGYWVQAVSNAIGAVQLMAITSCQPDFQPRVEGVTRAFPTLGTIVLNQTRLTEAAAKPGVIRYWTSGATANSYYYDEYYLGNPGLYKTYFVGINDACQFQASAELRRPFLDLSYRKTPYDPSNVAVNAFRADAIANTYAETSAFYDERVLEAFQIGADRILTRTAPPHPRKND